MQNCSAFRATLQDDKHKIYAEVDAFLENGTQTMAVEVKAKLQMADVDIHIERMVKLRRYPNLHGDQRDLFGLWPRLWYPTGKETTHLKKWFYVIEPSGEDVKISKPASEWRL